MFSRSCNEVHVADVSGQLPDVYVSLGKSSDTDDGGGVAHDSLVLDSDDSKLWSWESFSNGNDGSGGTNPAWHGTLCELSLVNSKNVCKKENAHN